MRFASLRQRIEVRKSLIALASAIAVMGVWFAYKAQLPRDEIVSVALPSGLSQSEQEILEAHAAAGDPDAQSRLAHQIAFYQGYGVRSYLLIRQAAEQQHPLSEYEMGAMLSGELLFSERNPAEIKKFGALARDGVNWSEAPNGEGIKLGIDQVQALEWFEKAAAHGEYRAWHQLAEIYKAGRGVPANPVRSAYWVQKLANAGEPISVLDYARLLERGEGVAADLIQAYAWALLAIDSAYPPKSAIGSSARDIGKRLESKLSGDDLLAARLRATGLAKRTHLCIGGLQNCPKFNIEGQWLIDIDKTIQKAQSAGASALTLKKLKEEQQFTKMEVQDKTLVLSRFESGVTDIQDIHYELISSSGSCHTLETLFGHVQSVRRFCSNGDLLEVKELPTTSPTLIYRKHWDD